MEAYAKLKIGNKQRQIFVNGKIDTRDTSNLLLKEVFKKPTRVQLKKAPIRLIAFGGTMIHQEGTCWLGVRFCDRFIGATFHVVNSKGFQSLWDLRVSNLKFSSKIWCSSYKKRHGTQTNDDHKPLESIALKNISQAPPILESWRIWLYSEIHPRKSSTNCRLPIMSITKTQQAYWRN